MPNRADEDNKKPMYCPKCDAMKPVMAGNGRSQCQTCGEIMGNNWMIEGKPFTSPKQYQEMPSLKDYKAGVKKQWGK